jgi:hypothetical protein
MDITREILNLQEAYNQVYAPQELTEEVEIAAQYFYEMGLNDEGVAIVIEELGCEEFGEFVYDLAEEYFLSEASETRLQMKGPLKSKKGVRAQSTTSARVKKQGGVSMKSSSAVSSTIKKDRPAKVAAAIEKAKEDQPRKRPVLDALARQIFKGMERHKAAMGAARETGKTVGKAAKGASSLAKGFASGMGLAGRIGKRVMTGEEVDLFDYVLEHLVAEGYADTNESALVIMANMSEEWREEILDEAYVDFLKGSLTVPSRVKGNKKTESPYERAGRSQFRKMADAQTTRGTQAVRGPRGKKARLAAKQQEVIQQVTQKYHNK